MRNSIVGSIVGALVGALTTVVLMLLIGGGKLWVSEEVRDGIADALQSDPRFVQRVDEEWQRQFADEFDRRFASLDARLMSRIDSALVAARDTDSEPRLPPPGPEDTRPSPIVSTGAARWVDFRDLDLGSQVPEVGTQNMIAEGEKGVGLTSSSTSPTEIRLGELGIQGRARVDIQFSSWPYWRGEFGVTLWARGAPFLSLTAQPHTVHFGDHEIKHPRNMYKSINKLTLLLDPTGAVFMVNEKVLSRQDLDFSSLDAVVVSGVRRDKDYIHSINVAPVE